MSDAAAPTTKRRKSSISPSARTLAECRKRGWQAQVVEQTIPRTFIKRDLFGFIDIVAIVPGRGLVGIQATGGTNSGNHNMRVKKILAEPRAAQWLRAGAAIEVWSWAKRGARGDRKLWTLRVEPIELGAFAAAEQEGSAP